MYRSLKRRHPKVQPDHYEEPLDAVVYGILAEKLRESDARSASKRFADYFVDLNDLRVSRPEEIVDLLREDSPATREIASTINRVLMAVFNQYNAVHLQSLKKVGKRPAKQVLEKLDGISRFVVSYCMLTALRAHAIPLTEAMIEYLRQNELVDEGADEQQIEGFLARQIAAKDGFEFYSLLRRESESPKIKRKKKTKRKTRTQTKTRTKKKKRKKQKKK